MHALSIADACKLHEKEQTLKVETFCLRSQVGRSRQAFLVACGRAAEKDANGLRRGVPSISRQIPKENCQQNEVAQEVRSL